MFATPRSHPAHHATIETVGAFEDFQLADESCDCERETVDYVESPGGWAVPGTIAFFAVQLGGWIAVALLCVILGAVSYRKYTGIRVLCGECRRPTARAGTAAEEAVLLRGRWRFTLMAAAMLMIVALCMHDHRAWLESFRGRPGEFVGPY